MENNMEFVSSTQEGGPSEQFPVGMRVLAVDDNPTCLRRLEELLIRCKYHVTKTMESKKALELLRENSNMFDLVISDVEMPDADGFKLLEIGLEMDIPVIMLSAHSDYDSVMKGIIHGACDYLVKPVGLKELRNIWQHVVKKNINSYRKRIGGGPSSSRQLPPPSEPQPAPNASKKRKDKVNESGGGDEEDSDREEEDGEWSEQDGEESSTRKKPRVVWSQELHQKFVTAVQQLGLEKAVPKKILDYMNIEGLTRENVASHLQKYRLYLKKIDEGQQHNMSSDASYFQMAQLDGLRDFTSTRQLPSSSLLSRSHLTKFHPSVYSSINLHESNPSSFNQHLSSTNPANPFGAYHQRSLLEPLQFPRSKGSAYMGDFKSLGDRGIGGSFFGSQMSLGGSSNALPSASSNPLMLQTSYAQPPLRTSALNGNQSCLEGGAPFNPGSSNMGANGLPRLPSHSWQGSLKTTNRYPSEPLPIPHAFGQDQVTPFAGIGMEDCTSLVSAGNASGEMQCEPQILGDLMQNMNNGQKWEEQSCNNMLSNPFGNVGYHPLSIADINNASRSKGFDETVMMRPTDNNAALNSNQAGKSENALVDNSVFDDIMNEMMKQDESNGMVSSMAARFGFDSFPPP